MEPLLSPFSLVGRIALVTGAESGLGLEMARGLANAGATVLINGREPSPIDEAVRSIRDAGGGTEGLLFDVTDPAAVEAVFDQIARTTSRLDVLVDNVGVRDRRGLFEFDLPSVRRLLEADLIAPF
jgi:gluconate 5-dehydrogenase